MNQKTEKLKKHEWVGMAIVYGILLYGFGCLIVIFWKLFIIAPAFFIGIYCLDVIDEGGKQALREERKKRFQ